MRARWWWAAAAVVCAILFGLLGASVGRRPDPLDAMHLEHALVGRAATFAWHVTWGCYPQLLLPLGILLLIVAWRVPAWRGRILFSLVMLLVCWRAADFFQHVFARPRRLDWVIRHETTFSFPSSHAAVAFGFYALWGALLALSELPRAVRTTGCGLLVALTLLICWSRLALGAHYASDLLGGALLAGAVVGFGLALAPTEVFSASQSKRPTRHAAP